MVTNDAPQTSLAPRRWIGWAAALTFILLLLGAAEGVMRIARQPPGYFPRNPLEDPLYIPTPSRGYAFKPGVHHWYVTPEVSVAINISSDGLRDTTAAFARQSNYRVLSLGDSFTAGLAVAAEDTWSEQLERLLNGRNPHRAASVVNAGVPGYSPHQIRLRMEELLPIVHPNVVVYGFTTETYPRMFHSFGLYGGTLVRSDALPGLRTVGTGLLYSPYHRAWAREIDYWLNQHFQLGAHILYHARRVYEALNPPVFVADSRSLDANQIRRDMQPALDEMETMHRDATVLHVPFVVLMINMQRKDGTFRPQDSIYNRIVADECRRETLTCVDLLPELRRRASGRPVFRTPHDQHWTPEAHALAARALLQAIDGIKPVRARSSKHS